MPDTRTFKQWKMFIIQMRLYNMRGNRVHTAKSLNISVKALRNWLRVMEKEGVPFVRSSYYSEGTIPNNKGISRHEMFEILQKEKQKYE